MARTRLTPVGKLFLALMLLFYVASVTSQSGLLLLLIGVLGGCFVVNLSFSRRNVRLVHVSAPREVFLVEGSTASHPWKFENKASKHAELMEVLHDQGVLFEIPAIKTGESISVLPRLVYERRGVYPNAGITLACAAPYGLLHSSRSLQLPGEVVVLPRIYETSSPGAVGIDMMSGGRFRGGRRVNHGTHFAGVRGWQPGDSMRQVHWKTTARRGEIMVKTFEEELGGRVALILDCSESDPVLVDNAVRAAGSLGTAALQEGHHLEYVDLSGAGFLRLAPFSDESEFLERLARYSPPHAPIEVQIEDLPRKASLAITGIRWLPRWQELISSALRQHRRVYVYLPEGESIPAEIQAELWHFNDQAIWESTEEPSERRR